MKVCIFTIRLSILRKKIAPRGALTARKNQTNIEKRYADFFWKNVNVTTIYKNPLNLKKEEKKWKTKNPEKPRKLKNEKIKKSQTSRIWIKTACKK